MSFQQAFSFRFATRGTLFLHCVFSQRFAFIAHFLVFSRLLLCCCTDTLISLFRIVFCKKVGRPKHYSHKGIESLSIEIKSMMSNMLADFKTDIMQAVAETVESRINEWYEENDYGAEGELVVDNTTDVNALMQIVLVSNKTKASTSETAAIVQQPTAFETQSSLRFESRKKVVAHLYVISWGLWLIAFSRKDCLKISWE